MTSSNCCSVILRMVASRVMPALLTMTSSDPNDVVAAARSRAMSVGRGDVAPDPDRVAAQRGRGLLGLGLVEVADDDPSPVLGERAGDRQPDALGGSGDHGGASCQHDGPFMVVRSGGAAGRHRIGLGRKFWACIAMPAADQASSAAAASMPDSISSAWVCWPSAGTSPIACLDVGERRRRQQCLDLRVLGPDRAPAVARAQLRVIDHLVESFDLGGGDAGGGQARVELRGRPSQRLRGNDLRVALGTVAVPAARWWRSADRPPVRGRRGPR